MNQWKKRIAYLFATVFIALHVQAADEGKKNEVDIPFNKGTKMKDEVSILSLNQYVSSDYKKVYFIKNTHNYQKISEKILKQLIMY